MIQKIKTITNIGLAGYEVLVEVDSNKSLPNIEIVWLPDTAIKESKERIRATFRNIWIDFPNRKIILNLSPSDIKKIWTRFDVPMATAILLMIYEWNLFNYEYIQDSIFLWELGLDGNLKKVNGILPSVISALKMWYKNFFVPQENIYELKYIKGINIFPINNFRQIKEFFVDNQFIDPIIWWDFEINMQNIDKFDIDFADIKWHIFAKRALSIAAAWMHNVLMLWAPGSGKTLLAKALAGILPPLMFDEILEVSQIYSLVGKLDKDNPLITQRQFRSIHHTASKVSIIWWWLNLTPWEISLAHKWILFFDELPEFPSQVLEVLRQPLEDKKINISRAHGTVEYPCQFMFVSAMNPCRCGYYKDREKDCTCGINEIKRYQSRISWPLLDRFDMILEIPRENIDKILEKIKSESSAIIRERVIKSWEIQQKRFVNENIKNNSSMGPKEIDKYIFLDEQSHNFLKAATQKFVLSTRVVHRMLKLARTIADINWDWNLKVDHLAEAIQYRSKNMFISQE